MSKDLRTNSSPVTIALSKGRLAKQTIEILERCGINCSPLKEETRKLILSDADNKFNFVFVKPSDVPTYVERGVADIGVVGKDTLLEEDKQVYEMLDLKLAKCRLAVAGYPDFSLDSLSRTLKVATKYAKVAKDFFYKKGIEVEIIKLYGSIELAPIIKLADVIVDIVESGKTLAANNLGVIEEICECSARVIVNKVSLMGKKKVIVSLLDKMSKNL